MAERQMQCQKRLYTSLADAQLGLRDLVAEAKRTGRGGTSWKRLNIYRCLACNGFHIGRANKLPSNYKPAAPAKKIPTAAELRRKLRHLEKEWQRHEDRRRRHQVELLAKIIEDDLAAIQFEQELRVQVRAIEAQLLGLKP